MWPESHAHSKNFLFCSLTNTHVCSYAYLGAIKSSFWTVVCTFFCNIGWKHQLSCLIGLVFALTLIPQYSFWIRLSLQLGLLRIHMHSVHGHQAGWVYDSSIWEHQTSFFQVSQHWRSVQISGEQMWAWHLDVIFFCFNEEIAYIAMPVF